VKRILTALFCTSVLVASATSSGRAKADDPGPTLTYQQVEDSFGPVQGCGSGLFAILRDIENTQRLRTAGKAPTDSVKPSDIAGATYVDQLLAKSDECLRLHNALATSSTRRYMPESLTIPGGHIERGRSALNALKLNASFLKNIERARLAVVNERIADAKAKARDFLSTANAMRWATTANYANVSRPRVEDPSAARYFANLAECASRMAVLANQMETYRQRTYGSKEPNDSMAPAQAVSPTNINAVMGNDGWLDKCEAEVAKIPQKPMVAYLPPDALKPEYGALARMKVHLIEIKIAGGFLRGTGPQRMSTIDTMIDKLQDSTGEFLSRVNGITRHASNMRP
jgi:hypothetical protein